MRAGVPKMRDTSGLSTMVEALAWPRQMVLWASVRRAARRHSHGVAERRAAVDHHAVGAVGELEGERAGAGLIVRSRRRRPADIHDDGAAPVRQAAVAGMDRVHERPALDPVEVENGAHLADRRIGHPVEGREPAVAMQEEAQARHHALQRGIEAGRHLDAGLVEHGADGKRSSRMSSRAWGLRERWPPSARIWSSSSAVSRAAASGHCDVRPDSEARIGQRDGAGEPGAMVGLANQLARQRARFRRGGRHEALVEIGRGAVEHELRVAHPGGQAPAGDGGGERQPGMVLAGDRPFADQRPALGPGQFAAAERRSASQVKPCSSCSQAAGAAVWSKIERPPASMVVSAKRNRPR
jgi:hypothetical protein